MKSFWRWCLAIGWLLGAFGEPAHAQGPTTFGWQREYYWVPGATSTSGRGLGQGGLVRLSPTRCVAGGSTIGDRFTAAGGAISYASVPFVTFLNNQGDTLNSVRYPGNVYVQNGFAYINDMQARSDHGFATVGAVCDSLRRFGTLLLIGDSLGRLRAKRYINMSYNTSSYYFRLFMLPDNSCIVLTGDILPNGHGIPRLYRFDADGNQLWTKSYSQNQDITTLVPRLDGSYALIGTKSRPMGTNGSGPYAQDVWIGGLTAWGDTLPARRYARLRGTDDPAGALDAALLPDGGLVLAGVTHPLVAPAGTGIPRTDGYLLRLDPAGNVAAQQVITSPVTARGYANCELHAVHVLADGRVLALGPYLRLPIFNPGLQIDSYDAAVFTCAAATLAIGSQQFYQNAPWGVSGGLAMHTLYEADGKLTVLGKRNRAQPAPSTNVDNGTGLLRLNGLPAPYPIPYCQSPPAAAFAATLGQASDTLRVREASTPGPRYGQLVLWRWDWGDGSHSDGPAPGPHAYAQVPAPGTPVTLTVTNNLGCTSTLVQYPWGRPSATQAAQALAAQAQLWPNPASASATLTLAHAPAGPATATVLDALGRVVQTHALTPLAGTLRLELDLRALPAGVYAVQVRTSGGSFVKRLVRE